MPELSTLQYIFLFTFLGSIGSLVGGILLIIWKRFTMRVTHFLASFAAGTLLGAAFFDLLPEASEEAFLIQAASLGGKQINIFFWTLLGILVFFFIERFLHWFHDHEDYHHEKEKKSAIPLIIMSDTLHNFIDGAVIAATSLVNPSLGMITTLAVMAHEIPQEIGDFGLLLHRGMSRRKVIMVNILSASASFLGAGVAYFIGDTIEQVLPLFLSLTAGFFIYIALSDIIPEMQYERRRRHAVFESILLLVGVMMVYFIVSFLE